MACALFTCFFILTSHNSFAHSTQNETDRYQCPMKCEKDKTYDKPGKCPVCGMALRKISPPAVPVTKKSNIKIAGAMMNVMRKGELSGTINLDTISNRSEERRVGKECA